MTLSLKLLEDIEISNPWLLTNTQIPGPEIYQPRVQEHVLLNSEWNQYWTLLIGPRRAGKTTLGNHLAHQLLQKKKFNSLLYINCDLQSVRMQFDSPNLIIDLIAHYQLKKPILFIDEAQRLENPGLLLKALIDLKLPIKCIASGSSQLEMKSKISESLTGRAIESLVLPPSIFEFQNIGSLEERLIYGSYPTVMNSHQQSIVLNELYRQYIEKDIIEILKLNQPDTIEKLITLIAHSSGQLVNYQNLSNDCRISIPTIQSHLEKLEKTYVIAKVRPFSSNKRTEITHNPKYYFIDNGFRNQAIRNFTNMEHRADLGALVENFVFQELLKYKSQHFLDFDIHFWRSKSKAEVDFIAYKNQGAFLPIEAKYRPHPKPAITKSFRSFLQTYQPKQGVVITRDLIATEKFEKTLVHFIPLEYLKNMFDVLNKTLSLNI